VIFAGTAKRPALGRAEVTITIDNSDGTLGLDFNEITVTRILFRTGESEYAINGVPCRLLDVQELLSDAGVGRQQHVIVSQGQIDAVLNARPEERRAIIEEAAGVLKYRKRKDRAERRLETGPIFEQHRDPLGPAVALCSVPQRVGPRRSNHRCSTGAQRRRHEQQDEGDSDRETGHRTAPPRASSSSRSLASIRFAGPSSSWS